MKKLNQIFTVFSLMVLSAFLSIANAALPGAVTTAIGAVEADAASLADAVWPVLIAIFGSMVLFKLFKRFGSKI